MTTKLAYEDVLDKFNAGTVTGKYGGIYVILVNPDTGLPYAGGGGGGGGDASAANQTATLAPVTPATATATKSTLTAGVYRATSVSMTDGQQVAAQYGRFGSQKMQLMDSDGTVGVGAGVFGTDAVSATGTGRLQVAAGILAVNPAGTLDRVRGDAAGGLWMSPPPRTSTDASKVVTTNSAILVPAGVNTRWICNDGTADVWLCRGKNAVAATFTGTAPSEVPTGSWKLRAGERLWETRDQGTEAIYAIIDGTGRTVITAWTT